MSQYFFHIMCNFCRLAPSPNKVIKIIIFYKKKIYILHIFLPSSLRFFFALYDRPVTYFQMLFYWNAIKMLFMSQRESIHLCLPACQFSFSFFISFFNARRQQRLQISHLSRACKMCAQLRLNLWCVCLLKGFKKWTYMYIFYSSYTDSSLKYYYYI